MIVCNRCLKEKNDEEFNWRWKEMGLRQRTCRECQKIQKNDWYARNADNHKANVNDNKSRTKNDARNFLYNYFSNHPCVVCGETDIRVLEFDHVRGRKRAPIATLLKGGYSISVIMAEIEKCEVVCANCHKKRTYKGSWREK
mgnify:CR=1 FL=1